MSHSIWLVVYCVLILLASLAGGWIPMLVRLTHRRMEFAVSFVAGVMLGVGLLHLLPHAVLARVDALASRGGPIQFDHVQVHELLGPILLWLLAGFLVMFFIERYFCFHHHDAPAPTHDQQHQHAGHHDHGHSHGHGHVHSHRAGGAASRHHLTWTGAAIGLSIHSLIEGIALAASVEIGRQHGITGVPVGLATFLVIVLHKPFDSLTLGTLMGLGGRSEGMRHLVNALFAMLIPLGVILFHLGIIREGSDGALVSSALAFSAGTFLCIAMSDLLPELQFHQHDRGKLSALLLAGLAIAWVIGVVESQVGHHEHDHNTAATQNASASQPHGHGHDHDHDH